MPDGPPFFFTWLQRRWKTNGPRRPEANYASSSSNIITWQHRSRSSVSLDEENHHHLIIAWLVSPVIFATCPSVSQSVKGNPHWQVGLQSPHAPLTRLPFIAAVVGKSWFRYYYYYSITSVLYTTTTSIYCTNCSWQAHNERMVIDVTHGLTLVIHTGFHNSLPVSKAFYWLSWKLSFFEMNNWIIQSCMLL